MRQLYYQPAAAFSGDERLAGSRAVELSGSDRAPGEGHKKNNEKKAREGALCIR